MTDTPVRSHAISPFNSALEAGLRSLILLSEAHPQAFDTQRLVFCDYLLVHSGDAGGPPSLHPATPHRSGEALVRRDLVERGLKLMVTKGLIELVFEADGLKYRAAEHVQSLLGCLKATYTERMRSTAEWVISAFGDRSIEDLRAVFDRNLGKWGGEFHFEALLRGTE